MAMEGYTNELLDRCVGKRVVIRQLTAPEFTEELAQTISEDPMWFSRERLQSRTGVLELAGYDSVGVTLLTPEEPPTQVFVPWSAVLEIMPLADWPLGV
jgi:hypothetical protein